MTASEKTAEWLKESIAHLPRVHLAHLPTPLEEVPRFSEAVGGPRILIKRDDLTGLPLSGNKTRMFEFSLAQALEAGADTLVHSSSVQSNYCRQLALACSKLGLEAHLVLRRVRGDRDLEPQGNLLLDLLVGAHVDIVDTDVWGQRRVAEEKAAALREQGRKVYRMRRTTRDEAIEAVAYVVCALELHEQLKAQGLQADYVFVSAHDTTQSGLLVGERYLGTGYQVVGINPYGLDSVDKIINIANEIADLLDLDLSFSAADVVNDPAYVGPAYGEVTPEGLEALRMLARTEAIVLDPVYSAKAMAGLIDYVKQGRIGPDQTVVFVHTGGFPTVFAYDQELQDILAAPVLRLG